MAKEILVKDDLTEEMIRSGREITKSLDEEGINPSASLWYYYPDERIWRLLIASDKIISKGPKKLYSSIKDILNKIPGDQPILSLKDIFLIKDNENILLLLRKAIVTDPKISGIRFSNNAINGHFIEDSYIYRIV
jgi:hypothetical protein